MRNFANRFLLIVILAIFCCGFGASYSSPLLVAVAAAETDTSVTTKTYALDQYNDDATSDKSLYDLLGVKEYHQYLAELDANPETKLEEVVIAVVDTGLNMTHSLFNERVLTDYAMDFSRGVNNSGKPLSKSWYQDQNGHGTHVAGVIADMTLANVKILPIKIFYDVDNQSAGLAFENAMRYIAALKNGNAVRLLDSKGWEGSTVYNAKQEKLNIVAVNMSLGSPGYDVSDEIKMQKYDSDKLSLYQTWIDLLLKADILPIVAAGNVNRKLDETSTVSYYSLPGACDGVLAVSAYDNTDSTNRQYHLASFSYHNNRVSVAAPGVEIWSACSGDIMEMIETIPSKNIEEYRDQKGVYFKCLYDNEGHNETWYVRRDTDGNYYLRDSGTSMAAPFVAACYALLVSDTSKTSAEDFGLPAWDADNADKNYLTMAHKALLAAAAKYGDKGDAGYDEYFGYGIVSLLGFATTTVEPLVAIENKIPGSTFDSPLPHYGNDETDWFMVVCVLLVGVILVWGINLFRAYLHRRNTYDSESDEE